MRMFLVPLAKVYLHGHGFRCSCRAHKARAVVPLALWARFPYQGREEMAELVQYTPGWVISVAAISLVPWCVPPGTVSARHTFSWSLQALPKKGDGAVAQTQTLYISLNSLINCWVLVSNCFSKNACYLRSTHKIWVPQSFSPVQRRELLSRKA